VKFNPIYIYSPAYVDWSAGIRVLHQLCDQLNKNNIPAWMAIHGPKNEQPVSDALDTPILDKKTLKLHFQDKQKTIAIYPETIYGNPLKATVSISWILNSPKLLGGRVPFNTDFVYGFTDALLNEYNDLSKVKANGSIFLPPLNISEIMNITRKENLINPFKLLYCQKFRALGGTPDFFDEKIIEVERFTSGARSRTELLQLMSQAEEVIVYENSTIVTEAAIIGTPVRCISNKWFKSLHAEKELGSEGVAWGKDTPKADANKSRECTLELIKIAVENLKHVLILENSKWQSIANQREAKKSKLPKRSILTSHSIMRTKLVFESQGVIGVIRFGGRYIYRWFHEK